MSDTEIVTRIQSIKTLNTLGICLGWVIPLISWICNGMATSRAHSLLLTVSLDESRDEKSKSLLMKELNGQRSAASVGLAISIAAVIVWAIILQPHPQSTPLNSQSQTYYQTQ